LAHADWLADLEAPFREAVGGESYGLALGIVFLAGLATAFTPCVYPMIVITVSVFGARKAESRWQAAMLSTCFVLGIAALFTPLLLVSAFAGDAFGGWLSNRWVLAGLAFVFVALALNMFGAFEIALPASLQNRIAQVGGASYGGAFALGLVSALIAAPCTGPVITFLMAWIATTQNVAFGGAAGFLYAIGLGSLFWVVGTFAISLPKSGKWLEWIKSVFAVAMVAMAIYYVRDLLPFARPVQRADWLWITAANLVVVGAVAGAIHLTYHASSTAIRVRKTLGVAAMVIGVTFAVWWLEALPEGARIAWAEDYPVARALAVRTRQPMLVDFGASWCGACGELDRHTFSDPRVIARARELVPVRVDLSPGSDTPEKRAVLASYDQRGLPLVVLHDRDGNEVARVTRFVNADELLRILDRVH